MDNYRQALTPQMAPIAGTERNEAGGFSSRIPDEKLLRRFLILGTEKGSYYADAREATMAAITCVERLLEEGKGHEVVQEIVYVSSHHLAPKNTPAILALAQVMKTAPDASVRRLAASVVPEVCRTGTHMAQLATAIQIFGGWGPISRRAVQNWISQQSAHNLAFQAVKYREREGWNLADLLRLSHAAPADRQQAYVFDWVLRRAASAGSPRKQDGGPDPRFVEGVIAGFEAVQACEDAAKAVHLIRDFRLPWEAVPSRFARDLEVQGALFETMPAGAMLRQLGRLTELGLLSQGSGYVRYAAERLSDGEVLNNARVHPMQVYLALRQYRLGHGLKGKLSWTPVPEILDALEQGFFAAFRRRVVPQRHVVLGIDVSSSMWGTQTGFADVTAAEAASVMAYLQSQGNPNALVLAFNTQAAPVQFDSVSLGGIEQASRRWRPGPDGTNCALPMAFALQHGIRVDGFAVYTDSQTWQGQGHPVEWLDRYRSAVSYNARLVDVALVANQWSIANTGYFGATGAEHAGMLQVVGLDTDTPGLIDSFLGGEVG